MQKCTDIKRKNSQKIGRQTASIKFKRLKLGGDNRPKLYNQTAITSNYQMMITKPKTQKIQKTQLKNQPKKLNYKAQSQSPATKPSHKLSHKAKPKS